MLAPTSIPHRTPPCRLCARRSVRVWRDGGESPSQELKGHEQAVWAVLPLPGEAGILSAGGDKTVRLWREGAEPLVFTGHTDVVRSLALVPGIGFASASNDGLVKVWTLDGACALSMQASSIFVYSVACLPSGELAACGEDRMLRIFKDGECVQTVPHPAPVWAVAALPNGDLATGCADGVARVFTADEARRAPADLAALFEQEVQAQSIPATEIPGQVGGVDVTNLPDESALEAPGAKEGQYKIVRDVSGAPTLFTWSMAEARWNKVGQVVGDPNAPGGGASAPGPALGPKQHNGKTFDYVFDVDIAEGQPPLQLPYNRTDDPWMAAQQFLWDNNLPQSYLEQTANFIIQNAGAPQGAAAPRNADPFTAGGAYVPQAAPEPAAGAMPGNVDPFTATGAYRPGAQAPLPTAPVEDPLSANRYRPGATPPAPAAGAGGSLVPTRSPLSFDTLPKPETVLGKLREFNAALQVAGDARALAQAEASALEEMGSALKAAQSRQVPVSPAALAALAKALGWPPAQVFPALDLLRTALLQPAAASSVRAFSPPVVPRLLSLLKPDAAAPAPTVVMALRSIANMTTVPALHPLVGEQASDVLEAASEHLNSPAAAPARTAAVTVLLNFSVFIMSSPTSEEESQAQILSALSPALAQAAEAAATLQGAEEEVALRLLAAVGTLCHSTVGKGFVRQLATDLGIAESVRTLAAPSTPERARQCAQAVVASLS